MPDLDRAAMEILLGRLEEEGYLFPEYRLYRINGQLQLLGKGGFSAVYEMTEKNAPENHYAVKVIGLERHTMTSTAFEETTILQRRLSSQSPSILRIIDVRKIYVSLDEDGELTGIYGRREENWNGERIPLRFILMEKLECILVKDKFKNVALVNDALQEETEILKFAMQIGQAILIAHRNNVLHRDIKLENIFWDEKEKSYKLGDFGIAKYVEEGNAETIVYTDGYGAPEIERRLSDSYNVTADIYSFGISLYLLLNGLRFPGSGGYYVNLVQYDPNFIFPAPEKASDGLVRVIRKMCRYQREERYQTMDEVLSDLQRLSERAGIAGDKEYDIFADLATETYREEKENGKESRVEDVPGFVKTGKGDRAQRKQLQKKMDEAYSRVCGGYIISFCILFILFIAGTQTDIQFVSTWQSWVLLIFAFITAVMQKIRDFDIMATCITVVFGIYSVYTIGFQIPHIILLACVMTGVPMLTAAGAIGSGIWMLLAWSEKLSVPAFFGRHDLCWIFFALILILADRMVRLVQNRKRIGDFRASVLAFVFDKLPLVMIISGVPLSILQHFKILSIPVSVSRLHLVRTGIIVLLISVREMRQKEESERDCEKIEEDGEEIEEEDVYMDKRGD